MSGLEIFTYTHRQRMSSLHADDAGVARGESHCACVQNLALSENRRKGAVQSTGWLGARGGGSCFLMPTLNVVRNLQTNTVGSRDNL